MPAPVPGINETNWDKLGIWSGTGRSLAERPAGQPGADWERTGRGLGVLGWEQWERTGIGLGSDWECWERTGSAGLGALGKYWECWAGSGLGADWDWTGLWADWERTGSGPGAD